MNRSESQNVAEITGNCLPPAQRQGPARVLFIHHNMLGFVTYAGNLRRFTAERDDVDAVHIDLVRPTWLKLLNATPPALGRWDFRHWRSAMLWRPILRHWFDSILPLSRFDVIHFLGPLYAWAMLGLRLEGRRVKLVVNSDCTAALFARELDWPTATQRPVARLEQRIFAAADLAVAWSNWAAASMDRDYGVPRDKLLLVRGCPADQTLSPPHAPPPKRGSLPRIIFVGGDWARKGGPVLLAAHQRRFADRAELHIVSRQAAPDPEARNVVWHGAVPHQRLMAELLPSMDVMALPTTDDMSPFALVEAAAVGLPVVATRIGGIPEIVLDGRTGMLFGAGDVNAFIGALDRLVSSADLRCRMGEAARRHVAAEFDAHRVYNQFVNRLVALADAAR